MRSQASAAMHTAVRFFAEARSLYAVTKRNLVWADCVSNGSPHPKQVVGAEVVRVIEHAIVVNFRPHEDMVPNVVADARAKIDKEVMAADEIVAAEGASAKWQIKAIALPAKPCHAIHANFLA